MNETSMIYQLLKDKSQKQELHPAQKIVVSPDYVILSHRSLDKLSGFMKEGACAVPTILVNNHLPMEGSSTPEDLALMESRGVRYYEIGRGGTPAMVAAEEGFAVPGNIMITNDRNLLELGALGACVLLAEPEDIAALLKSGKIEITVPVPFGIELLGETGKWTGGIDIALYLLEYANLPEDHSAALEIYGEGLTALSLPERHNLLRVLIDLGYENVLCRVDENVMAFLQDRSEAEAQFYFPAAGKKPEHRSIRVDLSNIHPMLAWKENNEVKIGSLTDKYELPVQNVFIGGDTACRFPDIEAGLTITGYRPLPPHVTANILPGSQLVHNDLMDMGIAGIYTEIGFTLMPPAFLALLADHPDTERTSLGTSVRILLSGGMLAGALNCFAAAMTGKITHPLELESMLKHEAEQED
ncbi:MAG: aconitase family protein [Candidatus Marinimicrobia bacterium]|nr:aconitase family protein [Candidatus Neomarinimicrobiota bacterium]